MNRVLEFFRGLAGKIVVPQMERRLHAFERCLGDARRLQRELLFRKIARCRDSKFGRDHHFPSIRSLEDFRRQVPVAPYDYYHPYIQRVTRGEVEAMFPAGEKLLMYTLSSGTTDEPKLIPINKIWMSEYRRGWQLWGIKAFLDHPGLFYAKLNGIAGNWDMRRTPTNIPCGMASGLSAKMQGPLLRMMYCVPPSVYQIEDPMAKYYTALRLSIGEPAGLFLTATPATVINFAKLGDQFRQTLIRDIADGTLSHDFEIPDRVRKEVARRTSVPNSARARELELIVTRTGHLYPKDYWNLSLVACWIGGTVGGYARHIPEYYGKAPCRDIGLLCSEGRFTIPLEDGVPGGVLEVLSHYYEFIPEDEIDSPNPNVLECHELEVGKSYFILLTTSSGLYRYDIQDVMRCTGFVGEAPILEFLHKGQRFSDMEGEKLSEFQFVKAVTEVSEALGVSVGAFTAVAVRPGERKEDGALAPYYALLIEEQDLAERATAVRFLEEVDRWLADKNVMYQGKRADGYLGPLRLVRIPTGSWASFDRAEVARRRVGEDHYKHPCLATDAALADRFQVLEEIVPPRPAAIA